MWAPEEPLRLKLVDGSRHVAIALDRSKPGDEDKVIFRIAEEGPAEWKLIRGDAISIGLTVADARALARGLLAAAAADEAAARVEIGDAEPAPASPAARRNRPSQALAKAPLFTPTQGRYLAFIHRYQEKYGRSPAEGDLQRHMLVSGPSVHAMVVTLEQKGLIARTPGQARSIRLLVPREAIPAL